MQKVAADNVNLHPAASTAPASTVPWLKTPLSPPVSSVQPVLTVKPFARRPEEDITMYSAKPMVAPPGSAMARGFDKYKSVQGWGPTANPFILPGQPGWVDPGFPARIPQPIRIGNMHGMVDLRDYANIGQAELRNWEEINRRRTEKGRLAPVPLRAYLASLSAFGNPVESAAAIPASIVAGKFGGDGSFGLIVDAEEYGRNLYDYLREIVNEQSKNAVGLSDVARRKQLEDNAQYNGVSYPGHSMGYVNRAVGSNTLEHELSHLLNYPEPQGDGTVVAPDGTKGLYLDKPAEAYGALATRLRQEGRRGIVIRNADDMRDSLKTLANVSPDMDTYKQLSPEERRLREYLYTYAKRHPRGRFEWAMPISGKSVPAEEQYARGRDYWKAALKDRATPRARELDRRVQAWLNEDPERDVKDFNWDDIDNAWKATLTPEQRKDSVLLYRDLPSEVWDTYNDTRNKVNKYDELDAYMKVRGLTPAQFFNMPDSEFEQEAINYYIDMLIDKYGDDVEDLVHNNSPGKPIYKIASNWTPWMAKLAAFSKRASKLTKLGRCSTL